MRLFKRITGFLLAITLVMLCLPMPAQAEEIETISVGDFIENVYAYGSEYSFTPTESGVYAFIGYVSSDTSLSMQIKAGDEILASCEMSDSDPLGRRTCCFEAEAGKKYTLFVQADNLWGAYLGVLSVRLEKAVPATGIVLSETVCTRAVGTELDLIFRFDPDWALPEDCTWESSDPKVVSVGENGHVKFLSAGSARVTVTSKSGLTDSCEMVATTPDSVKFMCHSMTGYVGLRDVLQYAFSPDGVEEPVTITSSNPAVANVTHDEDSDFWKIEYSALGTATLTLTSDSGLTDQCIVTVKEMDTISLGDRVTVTIQPGDYVRYEFIPDSTEYYIFGSLDGGGTFSDYRSPFYGRGSHELYLRRNEPEILEAGNDTDNEQTYTLFIEKPVPVERVEITGHIDTAHIGDQWRLEAINYPAWAQDENWTWASSDESVVSLSGSSGYRYATAKSIGSSVITVTTDSGATASVTVTVVDAPYDEIWHGDNQTLTLDGQTEITYMFTPEVSGDYALYTEAGDFVWNEENQFGYENNFSLGIFQGNTPISGHCPSDLYTAETAFLEAGKNYILELYNPAVTPMTGTVHLTLLEQPSSITLSSFATETTVHIGDWIDVSLETDLELPFVTGVTWSVNDESILQPDGNNNMHAYYIAASAGTATVTATLRNGITTSIQITVRETEGIHLGEGKTLTLAAGETAWVSFTPETSGDYVFYSPRGENYFGLWLNSSAGTCAYENYSGTWGYLFEGQPYLVEVWEQAGNPLTETIYVSPLQEPNAIRIESGESVSYTYREGNLVYLTCAAVGELPFVKGNITWTISDENVLKLTYDSDSTCTFTMVNPGTATVTATLDNGTSASCVVSIVEPLKYEVLEGNHEVVRPDSGDTLTVRIDSPFEKFKGSVQVDGKPVDAKHYTVTEGSTVITISPDYLATLEPGEHKLLVMFTDGVATATFEIKESPAQAPGDANGDGATDVNDAIHLLFNLLFGEADYPVSQNRDFDGSGSVDINDAIFLLFHVLFGETAYPLN